MKVVGGHWVNDMQGFLVTQAFPIAVGYSHELQEEVYEKVKFHAIHGKKLCIEDGGFNIAFVKWFKKWFNKDKAK